MTMFKICFRIRQGDVYLFEGIPATYYWQALRYALQLSGVTMADVTICIL